MIRTPEQLEAEAQAKFDDGLGGYVRVWADWAARILMKERAEAAEAKIERLDKIRRGLHETIVDQRCLISEANNHLTAERAKTDDQRICARDATNVANQYASELKAERAKLAEAQVVSGKVILRLAETQDELARTYFNLGVDRDALAAERAKVAAVEHVRDQQSIQIGEWMLYRDRMEAKVAKLVEWHEERIDQDGCCDMGILCSFGILLAAAKASEEPEASYRAESAKALAEFDRLHREEMARRDHRLAMEAKGYRYNWATDEYDPPDTEGKP